MTKTEAAARDRRLPRVLALLFASQALACGADPSGAPADADGVDEVTDTANGADGTDEDADSDEGADEGVSAGPDPDDPSAPPSECVVEAEAALAVLEARCATCHANGERNGGFGEALNLAALLARGRAVAGDAQGSQIYQLAQSGEMPPGPDALTPSELAALESWIECLDPSEAPPASPPDADEDEDDDEGIDDDDAADEAEEDDADADEDADEAAEEQADADEDAEEDADDAAEEAAEGDDD